MKGFIAIEVEIYGRSAYVSINQTDEEFFNSFKRSEANKMKDLFESLSSKKQALGSTSFYEGDVYIRIYSEVSTPSQRGTLAHEIFHAVVFILDFVGIGLDGEAEEAYAYLTSFLTKKIYEGINKIK